MLFGVHLQLFSVHWSRLPLGPLSPPSAAFIFGGRFLPPPQLVDLMLFIALPLWRVAIFPSPPHSHSLPGLHCGSIIAHGSTCSFRWYRSFASESFDMAWSSVVPWVLATFVDPYQPWTAFLLHPNTTYPMSDGQTRRTPERRAGAPHNRRSHSSLTQSVHTCAVTANTLR